MVKRIKAKILGKIGTKRKLALLVHGETIPSTNRLQDTLFNLERKPILKMFKCGFYKT